MPIPCPTCPKLKGPVYPSGPSPCSILLIGEAPHKSEDRVRIPFAGPTGQELDNFYLPICGLFRGDVAVTNAHLCSLARYRNPEPSEARDCATHHIPATILSVQPDIIVAMGAVACSLFRTLKGPLSASHEHGIPTVASLDLPDAVHPDTGQPFHWVGAVLPLFHPSAGIHDSNTRYHLQRDFPILKLMMQTGLCEHPVKPWEIVDYRRLETRAELFKVLWDIEERGDGWVATDTETDAQGFDLDPLHDPPFCLSFSGLKGTGYVVMMEDRLLLEGYREWLAKKRPRVVLHNALFDVPVLERMGVTLAGGKGLWPLVRDTMVDAYHTGWMEQGLKTLAYRYLGVQMSDFEDVVKPHAFKPQMKYLMQVACRDSKTVEEPYRQPRQWTMQRLATSMWDSCAKSGELPQDRIKENWCKDKPEMLANMFETFGPFPFTSIKMAPLEESVWYSAQDADVTRMVRPMVKRELVELKRMVAA